MSDAEANASEEEERLRRMDQMRADIKLKTVQANTEWPKLYTAVMIAFGSVVAVLFTIFGYILGRHP